MKEFSGIRRLEHFDYSRPGAYFITICTNQRDLIFGKIYEGCMNLSPAGEMIEKEWYSQLVLDEFVVMPNHFHAIVWIKERENSVDAPLVGASGKERGDKPRAYEDGSVGAPLVGASGKERGDKPCTYEDGSVGAPLVGVPGKERGDIPPDVPRAKPRAYEESTGLISLPSAIGAFKSLTTNKYIRGVKLSGWTPFNKKMWQQNYYEHIIRDERDLGRIREYIINNPIQWDLDEENPSRRGKT